MLKLLLEKQLDTLMSEIFANGPPIRKIKWPRNILYLIICENKFPQKKSNFFADSQYTGKAVRLKTRDYSKFSCLFT